MNNKDIILIVILFIIFGVLIFTTPSMDGRISLDIWILFIAAIFAAAIIRIIIIIISHRKKSKNELIEKFKNQHIVVQILEIAFIVLFIYQLVTVQQLRITSYIFGLLVIALFIEWFLKKEE